MSMVISDDSLPGKELFFFISIFFFYTGSLEECFKYRSLHLRCLRMYPEDLCILPKKSHLWEPKNIFMWFLQNSFKRNWPVRHSHLLILMDLGTWSDTIIYLASFLWVYISTQRITSGPVLGWVYICCLYGHCMEAMGLGELSEPHKNVLPAPCCMKVGLATFKLTITFKQSIFFTSSETSFMVLMIPMIPRAKILLLLQQAMKRNVWLCRAMPWSLDDGLMVCFLVF